MQKTIHKKNTKRCQKFFKISLSLELSEKINDCDKKIMNLGKQSIMSQDFQKKFTSFEMFQEPYTRT